MFRDPQVTYLLVNVLLMLVVGGVGWLLKRAISGGDEKLDKVASRVEETTKEVGKLQLLIVGDYLLRREFLEYQKHVDGVLEQLRNNIHNLRDGGQSTASKLAMLEGILNTLKETKQ